jgi:hypothetical protein
LRTTFIGIRKPFSISSTRTVVAGSKKFLPSIAASTQANEFVHFARSLRLRYAASLRRDRISFVLQHYQPSPAYLNLRQHFVQNQHSHSAGLRITAPEVNKNSFNSSRHTSFITNLLRPTYTNLNSHRTTSQRILLTAAHQFHTRTLERELNHRTTILNRLHSERLQQLSHTDTLERTIARHIMLRVRRVEQMPQPRSVANDVRALPPPPMQVVHQISSRAPSASQTIQEFRPSSPASTSPGAINFDAIAQNVMRHIDDRLCARRERFGRT